MGGHQANHVHRLFGRRKEDRRGNQLAPEYDVHSTVWHQGVFGLSGGTLESLVVAIDDYDFATLVLTPDDILEKREVTGCCPRDNVLFELGLFMGTHIARMLLQKRESSKYRPSMEFPGDLLQQCDKHFYVRVRRETEIWPLADFLRRQ